MNAPKLPLSLILLVLCIAIIACSFPMLANNAAQQSGQQSMNNPQGEDQIASNQQSGPLPTDPEPQPSTPALPVFNLSEPCSIVSPEIAEHILGQPSEAVEGPGTCVYTAGGMASITVAVLDGEQAKRSIANEILQLENGCSLSYSYSSDQSDPTPLPPEAEPLLEQSLQALMEQSLTLQESCGGSGFETLDQYGTGVYLLPFELLMPGGLVAVAGEDYTLSIIYIDLEQDTPASVEVARQIFELIVGE